MSWLFLLFFIIIMIVTDKYLEHWWLLKFKWSPSSIIHYYHQQQQQQHLEMIILGLLLSTSAGYKSSCDSWRPGWGSVHFDDHTSHDKTKMNAIVKVCACWLHFSEITACITTLVYTCNCFNIIHILAIVLAAFHHDHQHNW